MTHLETMRDQFAQLVQRPEDRIALVDAALLIACTVYPELERSRYIRLLDAWGERLQNSAGPSASAVDIWRELNRMMFEEEKFRGDKDNYYDPQNSFLNRVLERKKGIPITLSLVYSEVGRRAGFPVHGIALPGHFIVGLFHEAGTFYIDPFNRGEILTEEECRKIVKVRYGPEVAEDAGWKIPAGKKTIIKRMLRNLRGIYHQSGYDLQAFEMIQWILAVDPDAPAELKQRGLLYEAMGNFSAAVVDFEHYLQVAPSSEDEQIIKHKITLLSSSQQKIH